MKANILSESSVCFADVKKRLDEIKGKDGELSFRAQKTYEYLEQFSLLEKKKVDELFKKLSSLEVSRLKELHIHKLMDLLPKEPKDVKIILQAYSITVTNENLKKLADTIAEFIK